MPENLQPGVHLRPIDLARAHRLSTQAVRNYEDAGILPAAARTPAGYRVYTRLHARALSAFLALVPGHGHATATAIMQAVSRGAIDHALRLVDESHAALLDDRRTLEAVEAAVRDLAGTAAVPEEPRVRGESDTFIGDLSRKLGLRAATLRKWERAGLLNPRRDTRTGYRVYSPADVRDAQLVRQLRRGGYRLEQIAPVISHIHAAGGIAALEPMLRDWHSRLTSRSRAMVAAAAALDDYLAECSEPAELSDEGERSELAGCSWSS
ncbi:MAG: MerR family transcriptional regulator [Catenulispora sp.]|nr:MerR family transcriptional regulator [Catenulispora sp.]